jgi:hypothetical protein
LSSTDNNTAAGGNGKATDRNRLERETFDLSRASEYFDARELQTMTGQPVGRFAAVILKELCDNGIDAAESARVAPDLDIRLLHRGETTYLAVRDNGAGLPAKTVRRILNFQTRTSDKLAYRSPTRGLQGNALKTVLGIPVALGCNRPVVIEARGVRRTIRARIDPAGRVHVRRRKRKVPQKPGTLIIVPLPTEAVETLRPGHWGRAFALFNPHASVKIRKREQASDHGKTPAAVLGNSYQPTVDFPGEYRKFLPRDKMSPWWYDEAALKKLIFLHIAAARSGGKDLTLREFVKQFRGLTANAEAKLVCDQFPEVSRLSDFESREPLVARLLRVMCAVAEAPSPGVLGTVGKAHFLQCFEDWYGVKRHWAKKVAGEVDGVPFVFEVVVAETERPGRLFHGVNFSPTFDDPLADEWLDGGEVTAYDVVTAHGVKGFLQSAHANPRGRSAVHTAAAVHLIWPAPEFLDKGKTRLRVPPEISQAIGEALGKVTKVLYSEGERRKTNAARQATADKKREKRERAEANAGKLPLTEAVPLVLAEAVKHATGGKYPVSAHTLFYSVRPRVQPLSKFELEPKYFEQNLLPAYQQEHGPILLSDGRPAIYYEPRGTLYEPHTGVEVPLGTREVEEYEFPAWLFDKIIFIEKQGLWPVIKASQLAERFDMAIVAGEGYATEACRVLFKHADKERQYQLFVFHDADPYGYNIARTLREETQRMPGYKVQVIDLGLNLRDALDRGLAAEYFTRKNAIPAALQLTDLEREYFVGVRKSSDEKSSDKQSSANTSSNNKSSRKKRSSWLCRRVELNAFTAPQLIAYVESQLRKAGVRGKLVPPRDYLAEQVQEGYHEAMTGEIEELIQTLLNTDELIEQVAAAYACDVTVTAARRSIKAGQANDPTRSWRDLLRALIDEQVKARTEDGSLRQAVRDAVLAQLQRPDEGE